MRRFPIDQAVHDIWKIFPVRFQGGTQLWCHNVPTLLVQSMEGGFVTRNCPECGNHTTLPECTFFNEVDLWVACPQCKRRMERAYVDSNYSYTCEPCKLYIYLSDLLPRWSDI